MKKFLLLLLLATATAKTKSYSQDIQDPGSYMNAIENAHDEMNKKYMAYMSTAAHSGRARKIEKMRNQVLEAITASRYKTIDIPMYKGDNTLRKRSMDYIQLCYNIFNEEYGKIVNMEEIAEQSFDEMQAYILLQEKTNERVHQAADSINKASHDFAAKYGVKLVQGPQSDLSLKMEAASKLNHYRNQVYLVFFKCNWQDGEIVKAMNFKKVNDIEQGRNSLIRYADEGLKALDTLKSFEGDPALAGACRQALQFYKRYAETDLPKMTDYFLKQENFEKMKKSFEAKGESNRKKEDVDAFNKAVNEINAAIAVYNQGNDKVNTGRRQMLQNWENTSKAFGDTHMPKYKA